VRRWVPLFLLLLAACGPKNSPAHADPSTVIVQGTDGRTAELTAAGLVFKDTAGKVVMTVAPSESGWQIVGKAGLPAVSARIAENGQVSLELKSQEGLQPIRVVVGKDGVWDISGPVSPRLSEEIMDQDHPGETHRDESNRLSGDIIKRSVTSAGPRHFLIKRKLLQSLMDNPSQVARGARIVPSIKNGKTNGFKLYAIRPSSVFARIGLKNGDTIHSINGHDLTSLEKGLQVYTMVLEAKIVVVDLSRRGAAVTLHYDIVD
jgi:hypothetical protein